MRIFLLSIFSLFILTCDSSPTQSSIIGCTDESACNYDALADEDDGTCTYAEENFDCDGQCIAELDCNNECGGSAVVDECGICGGSGSIENFDCDGNCLVYIDCSGVCGGDNTACEDCNGVHYGDAFIDSCGDCVGGNTGYEENHNMDNWGICNGGGNSCFPNPFNSSATIHYEIAYPSDISLKISALNGTQVFENLFSQQTIGQHEFRWQPENHISSGIYFLSLSSFGSIVSRKLLLIK